MLKLPRSGGLIASTIAHHRSGNAQLQAIGKVIVLIMLIVFLPNWGNQIVSIVDDTVKNVLKVDPAKIHDQYQAALEMKKSTDGNQSWWDKLFNFSTSIIESLMSVVFIILGWLASTIEWWAYILQSAILFIGYALSPIFIGMLAFHPKLGARPMRDAIEKLIGDAVTEFLLAGENAGGSIHVSEPRGCLVIR